jgi:hypothetical protein
VRQGDYLEFLGGCVCAGGLHGGDAHRTLSAVPPACAAVHVALRLSASHRHRQRDRR